MADDQKYRPNDVQHYPLHMIVGIVPPSHTDELIAALQQAGVSDGDLDLAQGEADAERIVSATEGGFFGRLAGALAAGEDQSQRQAYVEALRSGDAVVRVRLGTNTQKQSISTIIADYGGHFINYYGQWVVESLMP